MGATGLKTLTLHLWISPHSPLSICSLCIYSLPNFVNAFSRPSHEARKAQCKASEHDAEDEHIKSQEKSTEAKQEEQEAEQAERWQDLFVAQALSAWGEMTSGFV